MIVVFDELWAYATERLRRLFDELGPGRLNPPYKSGGEADRGRVISRQPVVSGCDAPEVLQYVERTLDAPT